MESKLINTEFSEWMKSLEVETKSLADFITDKYTSDLLSKRDEALRIKIKENLRSLGYKFTSELGFEEFCQRRITLIQIGQFKKELYIDYRSEEKKGVFLISYGDEITVDVSEMKNNRLSMDIKMTIG